MKHEHDYEELQDGSAEPEPYDAEELKKFVKTRSIFARVASGKLS